MERREYIVALNGGVDYAQFWQEMETTTNQHPYVPDHSVDIVNERPGSTRSCHYALTDQEATTLRNDPRVYTVEIPPDQRDDIQIGFRTVQHGDFTKTTSSTGAYINWGLRRCIDYTNPYIANGTVAGAYNYVNDGTGVDIVIQDSGIQADHPEFFDQSGTTRVQQINWYTASGLPGTQSAFHYRDYHGHGTHCAGIAAGKNHGWAKNARIYSLKVSGLEGSGDFEPGTGLATGIPVANCFDVIKQWHNNKPIDPETGYKRPTVVNMSWGYSGAYININGGNYRGSNWSGTSRRTDYGMTGNLSSGFYRHPARVGSVDSDVQEMVDAGIIVCIAAGNSYHKIDVLGGLDYNNYFNGSGGATYYHRGMSPYSEYAISVASVDSDWYGSREYKSSFSNHGPAVTISAPGSNVMSACSNTNQLVGVANYFYPSFKQVNISGTSMASPQVAGVAALYLQSNPGYSPASVKSWLTSTTNPSQERLYSTGSTVDYTQTNSLWGGNQNFLYWPYSDPGAAPTGSTTARVSGPISFKGPVNIRFK